MSTHAIPASRSAISKPITPGLRRFGWFVLAYNVLVVLWGAVVRATGSGAGCGDHWPLCNGVAIPQFAQLHTVIEFTHRLMSGAALILVAVFLIWTWRATQRGALARWAAVASMILVMNEALLGALLVLLRLVAHNQSAARGVYLSFHFANTLLLLAGLTLAAEFLSRPRMRSTTQWKKGAVLVPMLGLIATLIVGVSGSLAALGDTLYPATSLAHALQQDFSGTGSLLLRLRWLHPACAVIAGVFLVWLIVQSLGKDASNRGRKLAIALLALLLAQYAIGTINILLLAPLWIQITHLLFADLLWICLILLTTDFCLVRRSISA
ncbi:MAG TPA: COX15/CtaA family protein [Acidobacteriaceae bacterium]|jgi:cytochrome c oxidase assembly protein subunit 15|nr:COX15/CtaA family protein [Acidobacteriaceae bacterium]